MSIYSTYLMIKQAVFDLPDLEVNPKSKITRLLKDLKWGLKRNGNIVSDYDTLFDLSDKDTIETIGDEDVDALNIASCIDKVNRVSNNAKGIGALATFRSDWEIPHITPLFKYKGKYYTRNSGGKYSSPYDSLDEIGDRWYRKPVGNMPIPDYVDFYDLPAGTVLETKDIRKILDEVKQKSGKSYRKHYKQANVSDEQQLDEARKFVEAVRRIALRKKLNFFLVTDGASGISNNGNPAVRNAREAQIKWELENGSDPYEDWGTKQASRLYTYVDPDADLSQGLLSLRNAPEEAVVRRYGNHVKDPKNRNKAYILNHFSMPGYGYRRPDLIFALDAPIPDNANEGLLRFRDTHKLVSWDPEQVKDIIRILRRYHPKKQDEVTPDFEPLKHIQWRRIPKDRSWFKYTPVYKILTESGRIPPELLREE